MLLNANSMHIEWHKSKEINLFFLSQINVMRYNKNFLFLNAVKLTSIDLNFKAETWQNFGFLNLVSLAATVIISTLQNFYQGTYKSKRMQCTNLKLYLIAFTKSHFADETILLKKKKKFCTIYATAFKPSYSLPLFNSDFIHSHITSILYVF